MLSKTIFITFANPLLLIEDHIDDLTNAVKYSAYNLYTRHKIEIVFPIQKVDKGVCIILVFHKPMKSFNTGNHLRGIASYLLNNCEYPYDKYRIGTRLLFYKEMD